jgi:MFS superfamily sulfate permease-like transporter
MSAPENASFLDNLKADLPASIVVFLVAVPLCLGIALASGAPPIAGIIAGIVGGIVVGAASGSPLGVSGPAAGLAVIVANAITELGAFDLFLTAVVIGGAVQVALGLVRAGIIGYYFPNAVIKGMLSGIGILLIWKQIPHALGDDKDPTGDWAFWQIDGHNTISEALYAMQNLKGGAVIIALTCLAILVLWEREFMKKIPIFKIIQGPLVAVATGIGLGIAFSGGGLALDPTMFVNIPEAKAGITSLLTFPDFSGLANYRVWVIGVTIAVVASLETLLCVEATDKLDPQKRITPTNRELLAQGTGNVISGMIGGLPLTQVIVRSSANIQSGGRTKVSAILHGVFIAIAVLALPFVLNKIPMASLAAILLVVGYKLAKPALFRSIYKQGRAQFIPYMVTVLGIVFIDMLWGLGLGLVVAVFFILYTNLKTPFYFNVKNHKEGEPYVFHLAEDVSFLNKASIMNSLKLIPDGSKVIVDGSRTVRIDNDILEIFQSFQSEAPSHKIELTLQGLGTTKVSDPFHELRTVVSNGESSDDAAAAAPAPEASAEAPAESGEAPAESAKAEAPEPTAAD